MLLDPRHAIDAGGCGRFRPRLGLGTAVETKAFADLKIEKAAVEAERRIVEADLGPVRYVATLLGACYQDALRSFILTMALLRDPAGVLLLLGVASARRTQHHCLRPASPSLAEAVLARCRSPRLAVALVRRGRAYQC